MNKLIEYINTPGKLAALFFAMVLALTAMMFFSSCIVDCRGAGRQNGYVGYDAGGHKASKISTRKSY